jgi:hypothetical protein
MAIAAAAVAIVGGVTQAVIAAKKAKKAKDAIKNYKRQELTNAYDDVRVSTLASELQREELARATASGVQALRAGGARTVIGGVGNLQAQNVFAARSIGADLDRQQKEIDKLRASDEVRIQGMQEDREIADLAGLGNEFNTQRQNTTNGINTAVSGVGSAIEAIGAAREDKPVVSGSSTGPGQSLIPTKSQGAYSASPQASLIPPSYAMSAAGYAPVGYNRPTAPIYPG